MDLVYYAIKKGGVVGPPSLAPERHRELAHRLIRETTSPQRQQVKPVSDILGRLYEQRLLRTFEDDSIRRVIIAAKSSKSISKQRVHIASINKFKSIHGCFSSHP